MFKIMFQDRVPCTNIPSPINVSVTIDFPYMISAATDKGSIYIYIYIHIYIERERDSFYDPIYTDVVDFSKKC